jgi:predicted glycosyltransferase
MAANRSPRSLRSEVVLGPQMPDATRARLHARYGGSSRVRLRDFAADMASYYGRADVVVSMAGYNTVCELLSHRRRAVLVPRTRPVREQLIRARRLAELGYFGLVEPGELSAETLRARLFAELEARRQAPDPIDLDGLARIRERTRTLLGERSA